MINQIKKELTDIQAIQKCAECYGVVGDPTRMKICWLLCHHKELSVGEISEMLKVSISVVSHSLKKLNKYEMVSSRKEHRNVFYRLIQNEFIQSLQDNLLKI